MRIGSLQAYPSVTTVAIPDLKKANSTIGVKAHRLYAAAEKGFVPIQMSRHNGKLMMGSATTSELNAENNVACEIVYQNGVTLKVKSDMTLEMLRTLILLCQ